MTALEAGITPAGEGQGGRLWRVLGHTYWLKSASADCFCFETFDPPGSFVPLHVHPGQDEFIYMLEGRFELVLGERPCEAKPGALVRMPRGVPHSYRSAGPGAARALFWVTPAGRLQALFDRLHDLGDPAEVVRLSLEHDVEFIS